MHRLKALGLPRPSLSLLLILLILGVAMALRLYGINWDSGYGFHPDERSFYLRADCTYSLLSQSPGYQECIQQHPETETGFPSLSVFFDSDRSPLNPHWFPLGSVLIYVLVFFRSVIELFTDIGAMDMRFVGRPLSALADVGSVFMVYVLGSRLFSKKVGLLAAALTALAVIHIQNSHFFRPETFSILALLTVFWALLRMLDRRRLRDSLLLGFMVGLAMAPKVSVLPLVVPLLLAYGYCIVDAAGARWSGITPEIARKVAVHAGMAGLLAVMVFFISSPYALLDFGAFFGDLRAQAEMARNADVWPFTVQYINTPTFLYQIQQTTIWGLGIPLGIIAWLSIPFTVWVALKYPATRRADMLLLAWVVPNFLFLEAFEVKFLRYVFPLMPFMILMSARLLFWVVTYSKIVAGSRMGMDNAAFAADGSLGGTRWLRLSNMYVRFFRATKSHAPRIAVGFMAVVVVATAFYALAFEKIYTREHPAITASEWIQQNVPTGTTIVSDNHWDEFVPELYRYRVWQFPVYDRDDRDKMETLAVRLAESEFVLFYSNRTYGSVSRVPDRFPFSANYYQQLFNGELGYQLERTFTSYPELLGVSFQDDPFGRAGLVEPVALNLSQSTAISLRLGFADDNVIGYDHPQVLLFRNIEHLPEGALSRSLANRATSQQSDASLGLMMTDEQKETQRSGGTWSRLFNRDGWTNQFPVLAWLLVIELIYVLSLPMAMFVFRPLPDRGIILARVLGLLVTGYITWIISSLCWLDFSRMAILVGLVAVGALSSLVLFFCWKEIKGFLRVNWRLLLLGEALFLMAFLAFVGIRSANPDLWHPFRGGEKPMELAYLTAVTRSTVFPPYDPWFAGGYLNYYYWGYFVVALPIRLAGILPSTGFNLAVPLFFALTFTGGYSIVYNLAAGVRRSLRLAGSQGFIALRRMDAVGPEPWERATASPQVANEPDSVRARLLRSPISAGLLAGFFISVMGNLDGFIQLSRGVWYKISNPALAYPSFDFWRSSRMIPPLENIDPSPLVFWMPERLPGLRDVSWHITEFPFFTFLFADLHAHMMVIPFTLLVIALGISLVVGLSDGGRRWSVTCGSALGLALGALWVINSWDYPSYVVVVVVLVALAAYCHTGPPAHRLTWFTVLIAGVLAVSILAFLPFHHNYETFDPGIAASKWNTPLHRYLGIHGLFIFVAGTFLIYEISRPLKECLSGFFPVLAGRTDLGTVPRELFWRSIYLCVGLVAVIFFLAAGYWTVAVLLAFLVVTGLLAWVTLTGVKDAEHRTFAMVPLVLLGMALLIGVGVDLVRLDGDIGRMNSLFKYYLEGWVLFSLASAYMLWRMAWQSASVGTSLNWRLGWVRSVWVAMVVLLVASGSIYTVLGTRARISDRFNESPLTLQGVDYMVQAVHWEEDQALELRWDLEAIRWLQDNVEGSPVVLEAHNDQYRWSSRIANYTGLPTVIGWPWHQVQQRMEYRQEIGIRARAVSDIYSISSVSRSVKLLDAYEVEYIVVGELEHVYYRKEGLSKFETMASEGLLQRVFQNNGVKIYRILWR